MSVFVFMYAGPLVNYPPDWAYGHLTDDRKTPLCGNDIDDRWKLYRFALITEEATCPECLKVCSHSRLTTTLYIIHAEGTDFYKIGVTTNIDRRFRSLQHATPLTLTLVWQSLRCCEHSARVIERGAHTMFSDRRPPAQYQREWFALQAEDVGRAKAHIETEVLKDRRNVARWVRLAKQAAGQQQKKRTRK